MEKQPFEQQPIDNAAEPKGHQSDRATALAEPDVAVFAQWMDVELEKLVARWVHLAAPRAGRAPRGRRTGL